ncbi:MAG: amidase [Thermoleophilaceae bacterium]|nr:amidase [Thermoleophilaceae bacterium]
MGQTLDRIDALDDHYSAFTHIDHDGAMEAARGILPRDPRPFAGVPIAIKDLTPVKGMPLAFGSNFGYGFEPPAEGFTVGKLREAGFIIVGKTATPEFGIQPVTESVAFGPTRNPWDRHRTPGGSSGGAAAAVAGGLLPIAHGSDGGGSIRTPAACCNLVGLKPSRGRISSGPFAGDAFLGTEGVISRTVEDSAALLDVLAGYEAGDANWAEDPDISFTEAARRPPPRMRIGVTLAPIWEAELEPLGHAAVVECAELLASHDHKVEEIREAPWQGTDNAFELFSALWAPMVAQGVATAARAIGRDPGEDELEPLTWELVRRGEKLSARRYLQALGEVQLYARGIVAALYGYDAILTPALAQRPPRIGSLQRSDPWESFVEGGRFNPYTPLWNVTGQPAITLPMFEGSDGLPLAVQLAGPPRGDALLLSLAAQLENSAPWAERRPPLP